ncbi:MAG: hypothetical protein NXI24_13850 [bacterium]|nr:hypothetical protein [bacterium]
MRFSIAKTFAQAAPLAVALCLALTLVCGVHQSTRERCREGNPGTKPPSSGRVEVYETSCFGAVAAAFSAETADTPEEERRLENARILAAALCAYEYDQVLKCDKKNRIPFSASF